MKVVAKNRRALFDFEILETIEAGMILTGQEAKSVRMGHANLAGAYVSFLHGKPILKNASISPYAFASNLDGYDPGRERPLLLKKREIEKLNAQTAERGISIVPLEIRAGKFIKIALGIGRGQKRLDKRQKIKERDMDRRMRTGREL